MVQLPPESYVFIKTAHMASAALSVLAFLVSWGLQRVGRQSLFRKNISRWLIHPNDTLLLSLGVSLIWLLSIDVMTTRWLQVKLMLVVAYIPLVMAALSERRSRRARNVFFVLALATVAGIVLLAYFKPALTL